MTREEILAAMQAQGMTMGVGGAPVPIGSPYAVQDITQDQPAPAHLDLNFAVPGGNVGTAPGGPVFPKLGPPGDPALVAALQAAGETPPPKPVAVAPVGMGVHSAPSRTAQTVGLAAVDAPQEPDITPEALAKARAAYLAKNAPPPADTETQETGPLMVGGSGPQYVNVPGHTVQMVSDAQRSEFGAAGEMGDKALLMQRTADRAALQAHADQQAAIADALDSQKAAAAQREAQRQFALRTNEAEQMKVADQVSRTQIDPDHLWQTKSAGAKVAGFIAMIAGGFLAGRNGGPNMAQEQINREIDADIDVQKANLANKRGQLADLKGVYAQKMARFGDERTAEAAAKSDLLASVVARGDAMATDAQSAQVDANWAKGKAGLLDQKAKLDAQLDKWDPQHTVQVPGSAAGGFGVVSDPKEQGLHFVDPQGHHWAANTEADATKLKTAAATAIDTKNLVGQMKTLTANGVPMPGTQAYAELKSVNAQLLLKSKDTSNLGVMSDSDKTLLDEMQGDPTARITDGIVLAQKLAANGNASVHSQMRTMGVQGIIPAYDAKTGRPVFKYTGKIAGADSGAVDKRGPGGF